MICTLVISTLIILAAAFWFGPFELKIDDEEDY